MAAEKEHLEVDSDPARFRPIELITENGFSIVRAGELDGARRSTDLTYIFLVRDPHGSELEIKVHITRAAFDELNAVWRTTCGNMMATRRTQPCGSNC